MKSKRHWLGLRVWVANTDGEKHNGTLWWTDETSAVIRENGVAGLVVLPKTAEGSRWGFPEVSSRDEVIFSSNQREIRPTGRVRDEEALGGDR